MNLTKREVQMCLNAVWERQNSLLAQHGAICQKTYRRMDGSIPTPEDRERIYSYAKEYGNLVLKLRDIFNSIE